MPDKYFQPLLGLLCSIFDAYSAVLFLGPAGSDKHELAASFSLGDSIQENKVLEPGQGLVGWVIKNNQPLLVTDFERQSDGLEYYKDSSVRIKSFMGCPLKDGTGVLCLDSKNAYSFGPKQQKILHQFVQLIETLLEDENRRQTVSSRHHYYDCLQEIRVLPKRYPRWSAFLEAFLQLLSGCTEFSYCFFASRDKTGNGYYLEGWNQSLFNKEEVHRRRFDTDTGLIGWVFRNQCFVSTQECEKNPSAFPVFEKKIKGPSFQSVICLPLSVNGKTRAVLVLADEDKKTIDEELKNFLEFVSEHLALFLENLYLKNKLRQPRHIA
jgi:transcriptional regulator with GAF, ATPase, and Fis domain